MPSALVEWLEAAGCPPRVVVADGDAGLGPAATVPRGRGAAWAGLRAGDLVVARSRHPLALGLLDEAEARGGRALIAPETMHRVRDKARCTLALARRGLPVPRTLLTGRPDELGGLPDDAFPLVVKPVHGDNARGVHVVASRDELAWLRWSDELLLAQAYVEAGGFDVKLYVAGEHVWATRRRSPLQAPSASPRRVPVTPALRRIADGCRAEFRLPLFGVDVLESADGLAIVDVNEFPNYTGVAEAPAAIGRLLLDAADGDGTWRETA
jgi:ribosomal protein S6--L-glutamate ligase